MTFNQIDASAKLVQTLARMELPCESKDSPYERANHDLDTLYNLILEAREILKRKVPMNESDGDQYAADFAAEMAKPKRHAAKGDKEDGKLL